MKTAGGGGGGAGAGREEEDMGRGVMASCSSVPTSPSSLRFREEEQDCSPMLDYYEFACQMEEAAAQDVGGEGGGGLGGVASSLSFRTCSSAPSSPRSVRSLSIDLGDFPPMSEWEEIPSRRWLRALETLDDGEGSRLPPSTSSSTLEEEEEKKPSRRWLLPPFLRPWLTAQSDGGGGEWTKHRDDPLVWYRDLGRYAFGDYSVAIAQANLVLEDQCQIESGPFGAFVGVYDGHGGPEAARYVCDHLYRSFQDLSLSPLGVTPEAIETAFLKTEEEFTAMVSQMWDSNPNIAITGSCCLVGVICHQMLYVASLGDSRVVLGTTSRNTGEIAAIQLSTEHNVRMMAIREELMAQNPDDPYIVMLKHGVWRIKGIIQVSRSIGDAFMKHAEYNREPLRARFRISGPVSMPILSAKPTITSHPLCQSDSFLIFASDGLWEHLSNQEAVNIVHNHPHGGAAKRLIKAALQEAARKRAVKYSRLQRIHKGVRRHFHDDITVIVLFLNDDLISQPSVNPSLSVRSALGF